MAYDKKSDIGKFQAAPGNDNTNSIDLVENQLIECYGCAKQVYECNG
jgi:hypothetical protein